MAPATMLWTLCALLVLLGLFMLILYFVPSMKPPLRLILGAAFALVAFAIVLDAFGAVEMGWVRR